MLPTMRDAAPLPNALEVGGRTSRAADAASNEFASLLRGHVAPCLLEAPAPMEKPSRDVAAARPDPTRGGDEPSREARRPSRPTQPAAATARGEVKEPPPLPSEGPASQAGSPESNPSSEPAPARPEPQEAAPAADPCAASLPGDPAAAGAMAAPAPSPREAALAGAAGRDDDAGILTTATTASAWTERGATGMNAGVVAADTGSAASADANGRAPFATVDGMAVTAEAPAAAIASGVTHAEAAPAPAATPTAGQAPPEAAPRQERGGDQPGQAPATASPPAAEPLPAAAEAFVAADAAGTAGIDQQAASTTAAAPTRGSGEAGLAPALPPSTPANAGSAAIPAAALRHYPAPPPAGQAVAGLQAVAARFTASDGAGAARLSVAIRPVELGALEISAERAEDGSARIQVLAERPETLLLLQRDAALLNRALQDLGLGGQGHTLDLGLADRGGGSGGRERQATPGGDAGRRDGERPREAAPPGAKQRALSLLDLDL